ncbi:HupE/UreJ family protein [Halotia branconii]|uniref:HupE/UreJ family protein n=1 Tax=Halotia branconii CENA392 TaxID=1539056 RepID=A0AAJ6P9V5_9CYAN|nr:HupE/UreJ family protein [Halotia branconii]WGV26071.1 HupE/UreJ family protein [Halotia branconii CENA392]
MFKIKLLGSTALKDLQHRHIRAIAALILISLLTSWSGLPSHHAISNCWEGLLWGIANPVIGLDRLTSIVAVGFLSARMIYSTLIASWFILATVLGTVLHLYQFNLLGAEIAIAISSIAFGVILLMPNQFHWLIVALLGIMAGLFQGYSNGQSIVGLDMMPLLAYIFGVTLTQYAVVMSAKTISNSISQNKINEFLTRIIYFVGFAFCAIGIVFLKNSIN